MSDFPEQLHQRELLHKAKQDGTLHRPLQAGDTFKGGLDGYQPVLREGESSLPKPPPRFPAGKSVAAANTGWICPKCDTANAPTNQTCFSCAIKEGVRS